MDRRAGHRWKCSSDACDGAPGCPLCSEPGALSVSAAPGESSWLQGSSSFTEADDYAVPTRALPDQGDDEKELGGAVLCGGPSRTGLLGSGRHS